MSRGPVEPFLVFLLTGSFASSDGCAALRLELEAMKKALSSTYGNKKGQRGSMKRTGSESESIPLCSLAFFTELNSFVL